METANAGREWSEMDIIDLRQCIKTGNSAAQAATFLRRTIGEVSEKAAELGLSFCDRWLGFLCRGPGLAAPTVPCSPAGRRRRPVAVSKSAELIIQQVARRRPQAIETSPGKPRHRSQARRWLASPDAPGRSGAAVGGAGRAGSATPSIR